MIDLSSTDYTEQPLRVREFYLGRQPILDRQQGLFAYELLFRNGPVGPAHVVSRLAATAAVIAHAAQLGIEKVVGDALGFINVDAESLMSDMFSFLPREKIVLEISESMHCPAELSRRIADLRASGFVFALDNVSADSGRLRTLLPLVDYVKLDMRTIAPGVLGQLAPHVKQAKKILIAEKVESRAAFETCAGLGVDFFQGYYFARPVIISGKKLSPSQLALIELMTLIGSDADNAAIEGAVKRDVPLAVNLLRLVNTPAVGARQRVESLSQALVVLGRRQLQRWLQITLYADSGKHGQRGTALLTLAATRGRLLELLAQKLRPGMASSAEIAFTVGIMSLMDTLFGMPMAELLKQFHLSEDVGDALLYRAGFFGDLLRLAECIERIDELDHEIVPTLRGLLMSTNELVELEMAAFEWSDNVARYVS